MTKTVEDVAIDAATDVLVELVGNPASIEEVLPRRNSLSRIASSHDPREQVLATNVDGLVVIGSLAKPGFSSIARLKSLIALPGCFSRW